MNIKICTKCKSKKRLSKFNKNKHRKDGFNSWCKKCCAEYRRTHRDKLNKSQKEWLKNHKFYNMKYYRNNKQKIIERSKNIIKITKKIILNKCGFGLRKTQTK